MSRALRSISGFGAIPRLQNDPLIASDEGRHLLRIQFDGSDPTRVVATERLLHDRIGGVRVVASGPDGAIYVVTTSAIGRLAVMR